MEIYVFKKVKAIIKRNLALDGELKESSLFEYAQIKYGIRPGSNGILDNNNEEVIVETTKISFNEFYLYYKRADELTQNESMVLERSLK
ncbi:hypothetical protein [Flammeovirga kamogawensis]|uniref:Uncharacterized protein n=1 Tax=Flammeovirga kamogawensis TaxID=373891 RepID=A0ABX8H5H6_9BACT|nr:hypothetical protein [Flammeovirga kamogawensis]MBB6461755.1 hypothetical protein [Flammeovirga kamogawensis]QWG10671.1 hypothetical protein KM029_25140 [Flammeovirga kamogawensis]TRX63774.1 hypothetical protein EO216_25515 [Flammeovirga kamogawensis]